MFSILGWSFVFCGKIEVVRPRPIQSAAVFFQTRILKTRTPYWKNTCKLVEYLGFWGGGGGGGGGGRYARRKLLENPKKYSDFDFKALKIPKLLAQYPKKYRFC